MTVSNNNIHKLSMYIARNLYEKLSLLFIICMFFIINFWIRAQRNARRYACPEIRAVDVLRCRDRQYLLAYLLYFTDFRNWQGPAHCQCNLRLIGKLRLICKRRLICKVRLICKLRLIGKVRLIGNLNEPELEMSRSL